MSNEVVALKYDDGEEYRTQNPYPEHNNGVCRQEKLNGTRAIKIDLIPQRYKVAKPWWTQVKLNLSLAILFLSLSNSKLIR